MSIKIIKKIFLLLFFLILPFSVSAEEINQFIADITVNQDASITVIEAIEYDFGNLDRHGILRDIPMVYGTDIEQVTLNIEILSITDEQGQPYQYTESDSYYKNLQIGDPDKTITGKHWYYITYTVDQVINSFETWDELYWNVTGNYWDIPINYTSLHVTIPEGSIIEENQAYCYTGALSSTDANCQSYKTKNNEFFYETTTRLLANEGLTIVASFNKNLVTTPAILKINSTPKYASVYLNEKLGDNRTTPQTFRLTPNQYEIAIEKFKYKTYTQTIDLQMGQTETIDITLEKTSWAFFLEVVFPFFLFLFFSAPLFLLWWFKGRDPKGRGSIHPIYESPANLTPGEIGVIVDNKADMHDITATIIRFAVEKCLKIEKTSEKGLLWGKKEDYKLHKLKELPANTFSNFEKKIWNAIFKEKKITKLSSLKNKFYLELPKIKDSLYDQIVNQGYYKKRPDRARINYIVIAIVLNFIIFSISLGMASIVASGWYIVMGILLCAETIIVMLLMPKRTKKGALMLEQILGFKMYLQHAERYRLERLYSPKNYKDLYEKFLPYAIALKIETEWAEQFKDLEMTSPNWYTGPNNQTMSLIMFSSALHSFNTSSNRTFTSNPSNSSGSSGFSGGSSGGGFGGGGGGSW